MVKSARVPKEFEPPFDKAESYVEKLFAGMERIPEQGVLRIGGERYVLMRCESLYMTWFEAMANTFGEEAARDFIYNTAREIGRSDSASFSKRLNITDGVERLSSGPVHFAHAGWALVEILPDSKPSMDDTYFLHYYHPNTFESEIVTKLGRKPNMCGCFFSAGYSAGWCSDAFKIEVHSREIRCIGKGDDACEFIMAPAKRLDEYESKVRKEWENM
jgi:hypothetical protein